MNKQLWFLVCILFFNAKISAQCTFDPPGPKYGLICQEAKFICGDALDGYTDALNDDLSPSPQPDPACGLGGQNDNISWFSFVLTEPTLELHISYSDCDNVNPILGPGLQTGIFSSCQLQPDGSSDADLACAASNNYNLIVLTVDPALLEVGNLYYFFVDGVDGNICDYTIDVISGVCNDVAPASVECLPDCGVTNEFNDHKACTGFEETYTFTPESVIMDDLLSCNGSSLDLSLDSIMCIEWEITPSTGFTITSGEQFHDSLDVESTITIQWNDPGSYTIRPIIHLNPFYDLCTPICNCTDDVVYTVTVEESQAIILQEINLCPGECHDFCGETYCGDTDARCFDRDACTVTIQRINEPSIKFVDLGDYYICEDNCFVFEGVPYCTANLFSIPSITSCDTSYVFELIELDLTLSLSQADAEINCNNGGASLEGAFTTNYPDGVDVFWISETGDTLSRDLSYLATVAGDYTFMVRPIGLEGCAAEFVHTVSDNTDKPFVEVNPPSLNCTLTSSTIVLTTTDNLATTVWSGPNGYSSTDASPSVSNAGLYTLEVTGTNGCDSTLTTEVTGDFEEPDLQLSFDNFDCTENIPTASYASAATIISQQWNTPDGTINDQELTLSDIGIHTLVITSSNGCTNTETFDVVDLSYNPSLSLAEDYVWRCNDTERTIDISSQASSGVAYSWATLEGASLGSDLQLTITRPGTYLLFALDAGVGCSSTDTIRITPDPDPLVDVVIDVVPPTCFGGVNGSIRDIEYLGGTGPYQITFQGDIFSDPDLVELPVGTHTLLISDIYECQVSTSVTVENAEELEVVIDPEVTINFGGEKTLLAETNLDPTDISSIIWLDDSGTTLGSGDELTIDGSISTVIIEAMDNNGCTAMAEVRIDIDYEADIHYPTAFSPNGDGSNDIFTLFADGYPSSIDEISIYDRAGELVYRKSDMPLNDRQVGWNGQFQGKDVQPGVFVFVIKYTLGNNESRTMSGTITLVR